MASPEFALNYPSYDDFVKSEDVVSKFLEEKDQVLNRSATDWYLEAVEGETGSGEEVYPGQGLFYTGHENLEIQEPERTTLEREILEAAAHGWVYYLNLANHPEKLERVFSESQTEFQAPKKRFNAMMFFYGLIGRAVSIKDIKLSAGDADQERVSRTDTRRDAMQVSYYHPRGFWKNRMGYSDGRQQSRHIFVGAANPEITGSALSIATLAQAHCLVCLPRDGVLSDPHRQAELAKEVFTMLEDSPMLWDKDEDQRLKLLEFYKHNVVGVTGTNPEKAPKRAEILYEAGIRTFRIYSPEPGQDALETLKELRKLEKEKGWEPVEIFVGQAVSVKQAKQLEKAGADAIYVGIGGGGRCITGVVSDLTIDWPQLAWKLRGKLGIPIIAEGGANDHVSASLASGVSGIGVAGKFGGSIETPGGAQYFIDDVKDKKFKYYGGEASDRMRAMGGRIGPLQRALNREGETVKKYLNEMLTMLDVLARLEEGTATGMVFQNAKTISEMQDKAAGRIRFESGSGEESRNTH